MKFGEVYIKWIKYLKKKGLYVRYRRDYSVALDVFNKRRLAIIDGSYWRPNYKVEIDKSEKFFDGADYFIHHKDNDLTYYMLKCGIYMLISQLKNVGLKPYVDWLEIAEDFGVLEGLYKRPKPSNYWEIINDGDYSGVWATASTIDEPREVRVVRSRQDEAHAGQWYDRYYNRGRHFNNRDNIRWRR